MEGAVLRERIGRPGLEVGAELAGVGVSGSALPEVADGDGGSEEEEGLGGFRGGLVGR